MTRGDRIKSAIHCTKLRDQQREKCEAAVKAKRPVRAALCAVAAALYDAVAFLRLAEVNADSPPYQPPASADSKEWN